MKVIDLLNKIANGEIPNRILYDNYIWSWTGDDYRTEIDGKEQFLITGMYYTWFTEFIKEEVEIIEEDNKIEKLVLDYAPDIEEKIFYDNGDKPNHCIVGDAGTQLIIKKINELIDKVNEMKNGQD